MASLHPHRPPDDSRHVHGRKCPTHHLSAFRKISGKWRGTVTQYSLDGQVLGSMQVESENRVDCDSLYTLLVLTDAQGQQQRIEFTSTYSKKLDGFVVNNPAMKGTALQVGDSVVYTYESALPTPSTSVEVVNVKGDTRLHTTQISSGGAFTGYSIIRETRVE
ncbi:DUF3598 family protein [Melittangium boletus]|uniref:DUF3598 domain-containing protein n=1 Tax=Melittangium boletus DSM 14713 TaxID=1294270 RepID=A0A250IEB0_9BACT|nr:DUF3598 family protein [Melittangium boletus]ATB29578.1 hypothetical protein MEBOL_003033 [Melittangium boletus DSM 14713]